MIFHTLFKSLAISHNGQNTEYFQFPDTRTTHHINIMEYYLITLMKHKEDTNYVIPLC